MILLHTGRDSRHKRRQIFSRIVESGGTVITPEQSTLAYESQIIRELGIPGLIDVQVTSFSHLINTLSHDILPAEHDIITPIGQKMLLRAVVTELGRELKVFRRFDKAGFY